MKTLSIILLSVFTISIMIGIGWLIQMDGSDKLKEDLFCDTGDWGVS